MMMRHRQLAAFFEKGGHAREALPHLLALKRLNPGDSSLLLRIGKGWAASESPQEALPYLNQYVQEQPDDIEALELLVNIYANLGKKADVLANLERFFAVKAEPDAMKLKQAARLYDAAGRFGDAVTAYRRYLAVVSSAPEAVSAMAAALRKLAVHGRYEELVGFGEQEPPVAVDPDAYRLMMAAAFAAGGQEQRAVVEYRRVIAAGGGHARMARLAMADLYREMGLSFAAEQVLRQALTPAGGPGEAEVLYRLFSLSLAEGELDAAGGWLRRLTTVAGGTSAAWQARLAEVELLAGNGEYRAADRGGRRLLAELAERKGTGEARARVAMALARFAIADGALPVALRQLESRFRGGGTLPLEVVVLQQHLYGELGEIAKADGVFLRALSEADRADDGLLRLAELYRREGMAQAMLKVATLAHQRLPDSLRAAVLRAEAWLLVGETDKGLAALRQLVDAFPLESRAAALLVRFCFARGRYGEALAAAEKVLARDGDRPDILLLKARCLWVLQRGPEALKIYQSYLTPAVAGQLGDEIKAEGLSCPPLVTKPTFWQIVSLRGESEAGFIDTLMSAAHAAAAETDSSRGRLQVLADAHYARYRWQKRFAFEFAARRAEQNKEYLYAARQYQALLRREPENGALLFDLARIYSRLGWSGEEAALYDQLAEQQADFPGLGEVRQRNRLKRRPRTTLSYGYENEEGRDGYKAIRRDWQEASLWLSPWSRHELDLSVSRRRYRSTDGDGKARSSRAMLSYAAGLTSWLSARVGGGFELPDKNELSETTLFQGELTGKIGDKVNARLTYERDPVTDTYGSFVRNVVRETVRGGGSLDLLPRLQAGGDYAYTDFSDGNRTKGYDFWGAYVLFTEPNFLQFCYRYDFLDSQEGPQGTKLPGADDFAVEDHPYWAPQNYWSNRFSVLFRHQFAGETLDHSRPSYYTAEYSVAYDARGRQLQTVGGTLCLELTQHFLATAGASLTSSDVYRAKDVSLSIAYRW